MATCQALHKCLAHKLNEAGKPLKKYQNIRKTTPKINNFSSCSNTRKKLNLLSKNILTK